MSTPSHGSAELSGAPIQLTQLFLRRIGGRAAALDSG